MRILLVEDENHVRLALARPLTAWGHIVTEAASAHHAVTTITGDNFDLAVVDVNLPDGTGWDVLACLPPATLTVVISAIAPSTERLRQYRPIGVLLKPFPIESLRQLVSRVDRTAARAAGDVSNA